jgi:hypothetical protein
MVGFRCRADRYQRIIQAAQLLGKTPSELMREAALDAADRALNQNTTETAPFGTNRPISNPQPIPNDTKRPAPGYSPTWPRPTIPPIAQTHTQAGLSDSLAPLSLPSIKPLKR